MVNLLRICKLTGTENVIHQRWFMVFFQIVSLIMLKNFKYHRFFVTKIWSKRQFSGEIDEKLQMTNELCKWWKWRLMEKWDMIWKKCLSQKVSLIMFHSFNYGQFFVETKYKCLVSQLNDKINNKWQNVVNKWCYTSKNRAWYENIKCFKTFLCSGTSRMRAGQGICDLRQGILGHFRPLLDIFGAKGLFKDTFLFEGRGCIPPPP